MTNTEASLAAANALEEAIDRKIAKAAAKRTRTTARVERIAPDGTVWVVVDGSDTETPASNTAASVAPGDMVNVTVTGGRLTVDGNTTDPSAGVVRVRRVEIVADEAAETAGNAVRGAAAASQAALNAQRTADEAQAVAEATDQHFWSDTDGIHVTDVTQDAWGDSTSQDYHAGHNILLNSLGILLRTALRNLVSITKSAIAFFDGEGNSASNIVASFGSDGAQIGRAGESHLELDYHSLQLVATETGGPAAYLNVSDLRGADGYTVFEETKEAWTNSQTLFTMQYNVYEVVSIFVNGTAYTDGCTVGWGGPRNITLNTGVNEGDTVVITYKSTDTAAKAFTFGSRASGSTVGAMSVTMGQDLAASGRYSYAEGSSTSSLNWCTHSEGYDTIASGEYSHAEGFRCEAAGNYSHAEGNNAEASGYNSHAEGGSTEASGQYSHAQNFGTIATGKFQTVIGKYNIADTTDGNGYGEYLFIIGNGTADNARSNALAVKWDGAAIMQAWAGVIQMFAGSTPPAGWLLCDGSAVSRTDYATLFAAIGTTWGVGDGSTTFNLPDLRGRAPIGAGAGSGLTARTLGGKLGSEYIQAHTHGFTQPTITSKYKNDGTTGGSARRYVQDGTSSSTTLATASGGAVGAVSGATTGSAGNMQPSAVVNFIIHTGKF